MVACPSGSTCATSSRHAMRLTRASRRGLRQRRQRAVPDHGDAHAAGVEALGVRADDRSVDASAAALVDAAVGVDQEVVANVVPAVRAHVVGVDRADDRGHVAWRVAVRRVGVMHEDHAHRVGVARSRPAHRLVRPPPGPRDDGRLTRRRRRRPHGAQRAAAGRHERDVHPPGPARPHLEQPAAGEPDRLCVADRPAAVGLQPGPARPGARARARRTSTSAPGRAAQRAPSRSNVNGALSTGRTCRPGVPGALSASSP